MLTFLSNDYVINSFGMNTWYSNPSYLFSLPLVLFEMNTYLHIVFTSLLGIVLIKVINIFTDPIVFINNFSQTDEKIAEYINN